MWEEVPLDETLEKLIEVTVGIALASSLDMELGTVTVDNNKDKQARKIRQHDIAVEGLRSSPERGKAH